MIVRAVADGPITFTDEKGNHYSIPVTALVFEETTLKATKWLEKSGLTEDDDQKRFNSWLKYLADTKVVVPGQGEPPKPAMVIKAVAEGLSGNDIRVEFSNFNVVDPADPLQTTFTTKIRETQEYIGLKPETLKITLGTGVEGERGTRPGLVTIPKADVPTLPKNGDYQLAGTATEKAKADITKHDGGEGKAFTVEARRVGDQGKNIKVTITDANPDNNTFTLRAQYVEVITGLTTRTLRERVAGTPGTEFIIELRPPQEGGAFDVPSPGIVALSGGREEQAATPASVTVFTA